MLRKMFAEDKENIKDSTLPSGSDRAALDQDGINKTLGGKVKDEKPVEKLKPTPTPSKLEKVVKTPFGQNHENRSNSSDKRKKPDSPLKTSGAVGKKESSYNSADETGAGNKTEAKKKSQNIGIYVFQEGEELPEFKKIGFFKDYRLKCNSNSRSLESSSKLSEIGDQGKFEKSPDFVDLSDLPDLPDVDDDSSKGQSSPLLQSPQKESPQAKPRKTGKFKKNHPKMEALPDSSKTPEPQTRTLVEEDSESADQVPGGSLDIGKSGSEAATKCQKNECAEKEECSKAKDNVAVVEVAERMVVKTEQRASNVSGVFGIFLIPQQCVKSLYKGLRGDQQFYALCSSCSPQETDSTSNPEAGERNDLPETSSNQLVDKTVSKTSQILFQDMTLRQEESSQILELNSETGEGQIVHGGLMSVSKNENSKVFLPFNNGSQTFFKIFNPKDLLDDVPPPPYSEQDTPLQTKIQEIHQNVYERTTIVKFSSRTERDSVKGKENRGKNCFVSPQQKNHHDKNKRVFQTSSRGGAKGLHCAPDNSKNQCCDLCGMVHETDDTSQKGDGKPMSAKDLIRYKKDIEAMEILYGSGQKTGERPSQSIPADAWINSTPSSGSRPSISAVKPKDSKLKEKRSRSHSDDHRIPQRDNFQTSDISRSRSQQPRGPPPRNEPPAHGQASSSVCQFARALRQQGRCPQPRNEQNQNPPRHNQASSSKFPRAHQQQGRCPQRQDNQDHPQRSPMAWYSKSRQNSVNKKPNRQNAYHPNEEQQEGLQPKADHQHTHQAQARHHHPYKRKYQANQKSQ